MGDSHGHGIPVQPLMMSTDRTRSSRCLLAGLRRVACASRTAQHRAAAHASRAATYTQVQSILRNSCEHCHNEDKTKGGLLMDSYAALARRRREWQGDRSRRERVEPPGADDRGHADAEDALQGGSAARGRSRGDPPLDRRGGAGAAPRRTEPAASAFTRAGHQAGRPGGRRRRGGRVRSRLAPPRRRQLQVRAPHGRSPIARGPATLAGHADLVRALAFSPDGRRLAVAGGPSGRFGEIKIWDVQAAAPALVSTIQGHTDTILAIAFSPDGAHHRERGLRQAGEALGRGHRQADRRR